MIAYMIICALLFLLAGFLVLEHAVKTAAMGYQDELGFHQGSDPQRTAEFAPEMASVLVSHRTYAPRAGTRTRRILKRAARESVGHVSAARF